MTISNIVFVAVHKENGSYLGVHENGEELELYLEESTLEFSNYLFWSKIDCEAEFRHHVANYYPNYTVKKVGISLSIEEIE